jgi:hypothetical protein
MMIILIITNQLNYFFSSGFQQRVAYNRRAPKVDITNARLRLELELD